MRLLLAVLSKSLKLTSPSQSRKAIGLCYLEVFTFRRWGGRSSLNLSNLAVKQRNRVYAVPSGESTA